MDFLIEDDDEQRDDGHFDPIYPQGDPANDEIDKQDAHDAMIYKDGILDYDAHDAYLTSLGYTYLALPCNCGGSNEDGHMPHCGWGREKAKWRSAGKFKALRRRVTPACKLREHANHALYGGRKEL